MSVSTLRRFLQYGAVKLSSRSEGAWISSSFTPGRRTARMSSASSARQRVRRLSAWLARRFGSFVPRNSERSTSSSTPRHRAQALVSVKVHRQRVECTDICPHEPRLLLAGSNDLLAIGERGLQREPVGNRQENLGHVRRHVGANEGHPPTRLVHQHHPDPPSSRSPRRHDSRGPGTVRKAASFRSRLTTVIARVFAGWRKGALA